MANFTYRFLIVHDNAEKSKSRYLRKIYTKLINCTLPYIKSKYEIPC